MLTRVLKVMLQSRAFGVQVPITENDMIHFFTLDAQTEGFLSGEFVIQAIAVYLTTGRLQEQVRRAQNGEPPPKSMPGPTAKGVRMPPDKIDRAELRAQRRRNRGRRLRAGMIIVVLLFSGCVTAATVQDVAERYSGVDQTNPSALERFRVRYNDCVRMSRTVVNIGGGLIGAAATAGNLAQASNDMEQCMADAGYVYVPTPEEREGRAAFYREHCRNVYRGRPDKIAECGGGAPTGAEVGGAR